MMRWACLRTLWSKGNWRFEIRQWQARASVEERSSELPELSIYSAMNLLRKPIQTLKKSSDQLSNRNVAICWFSQSRAYDSRGRRVVELVSILRAISFRPKLRLNEHRTTEILDVAPIDLFGGLRREAVKDWPPEILSEDLKKQAIDLDIHWVTETGSGSPAKLTSEARVIPTVSSYPFPMGLKTICSIR